MNVPARAISSPPSPSLPLRTSPVYWRRLLTMSRIPLQTAEMPNQYIEIRIRCPSGSGFVGRPSESSDRPAVTGTLSTIDSIPCAASSTGERL